MTRKDDKILELPDGSVIKLIWIPAKRSSRSQSEREQNVIRLNRQGQLVWRISNAPHVYPGSTFTGIYFDDTGRLLAYSYDGVEYEIDIDSGIAKSGKLIR